MRIPVKKERVFRAIILRENFGFKEILKETELSKSFVSKILSELEEENLILSTGEKFKVLDKIELVKAWASLKRKILFSLKPFKIFMFVKSKIKELKNYAISGSFAESLINHQTRGEEMVVYVPKEKLEEVVRIMGNYKSKNPNIFIYGYDGHLFKYSWKLRGWSLVSIPELCADLIALAIHADVGLELFKRWLSQSKR